jgi:hypothetical protein
MNLSKVILIVALLLLLPIMVSAQNTSKIGFFVTIKGDTVIMHKRTPRKTPRKDALGNDMPPSHYAINGVSIYYAEKSGKQKKMKQRNISEVHVGNDVYLRNVIGSAFGLKRLHRIIVETPNYLLSEYYFDGDNFWYLFDKKNDKFVFKQIELRMKKDQDIRYYTENILPYFSVCEEFLKVMEIRLSKDSRSQQTLTDVTNRTSTTYLFEKVSNIQCQ